MPFSDYILTAPCSELASQVMADVCDSGHWVAPCGPTYAAAFVGVLLNAAMIYAAGMLLIRVAQFLWKWREAFLWKVVLGVCVCGIAYQGMTKAYTSRVNFPPTDPEVAYLIDNGSYVSNDVVHVDFNTFLIPGDAPIALAYWPNESTNEADIVELFIDALSAWPRPLDFEFENAISNRWYCYTTWTPGPAAHTNGVFQQVWMTDRRENRNAIPIRTIIIEDGEQIAPPHFEREEEP